MKNDVIHDSETLPNFYWVGFLHATIGQWWEFEISDWRDDRDGLLRYLHDVRLTPDCRLVGFNNVGFDYPILHDFMRAGGVGMDASAMFRKSQQIITGQNINRFGARIAPWDVLIPQVDLFLIHHFDNMMKNTGLKPLQFNMRAPSIEEMPIPHSTPIHAQDRRIVRDYGFHDITETLRFYWLSKPLIDFRDQLTATTGRDHTNLNDTAIGKKYFIEELEKLAPGICFHPKADGKGRGDAKQTHRNVVKLRDVIFPYIQFQRPEFQRVLQLFMAHETHGYQPAFEASCVVDGFRFDFGVGGIHGSVNNQTIYANEEMAIYDLDVAAFYPSLAIANKMRPEHLGDYFPVVYAQIAEQRKQYPKGSPENAMLKLANNGVYGDSGNIYSPFYDPQYMLATTVNGQLLLCMLAEYLLQIPGLKIIQANTDGMTVHVPRAALPSVDAVCEWWQRFTCLTLEFQHYSAMFIRDVNCYLAVDTAGKVKKRKAAFSWVVGPNLGAGELAWHQDHSALIVPMAAERHMLKGTPLSEIIHGHRNLYDFCIRAKAKKGSHLELGDGTQFGRLLRYYVSTDGQPLFKIMPPAPGCHRGHFKRANNIDDATYFAVLREIGSSEVWDARIHTKNRSVYADKKLGIEAGYLIHPCNDIRDASFGNINYEWYIRQAADLVKSVGFRPNVADDDIPF